MNNGNIFSFVEQGVTKRGTSIPDQMQKKTEPTQFHVFRKRKFLWWYKEQYFCVCHEIVNYEDIVVCKYINGEVVAILLKQDFSCALSTKLFDE